MTDAFWYSRYILTESHQTGDYEHTIYGYIVPCSRIKIHEYERYFESRTLYLRAATVCHTLSTNTHTDRHTYTHTTHAHMLTHTHFPGNTYTEHTSLTLEGLHEHSTSTELSHTYLLSVLATVTRAFSVSCTGLASTHSSTARRATHTTRRLLNRSR